MLQSDRPEDTTTEPWKACCHKLVQDNCAKQASSSGVLSGCIIIVGMHGEVTSWRWRRLPRHHGRRRRREIQHLISQQLILLLAISKMTVPCLQITPIDRVPCMHHARPVITQKCDFMSQAGEELVRNSGRFVYR